ncbi:chromosomal replication initiator protein DnaA [Actinomyces sp. HMT897]|uniref:chromosomal replication initiator protein DnaA n=1 Tax=Actinomyces sp. HMT897 TaxID=2789424 RepID=UPI00190A568D|nr:chromosomal replication initiator protein DnaA [Actinomyces sp. HMT897]QQO76867.1 chromosomal replication initiator protein DnaA [Actinomyces sp. HMT897]
MPDTATTMWLSALEALASSGELGQGKVSIIRMTRVIDVDGTLVLVVGSGFAKDIVEQSRGPISRALASVAGTDVPFEVIVDTSLENSAPVFPRAPIVPIPPAAPTFAPRVLPTPPSGMTPVPGAASASPSASTPLTPTQEPGASRQRWSGEPLAPAPERAGRHVYVPPTTPQAGTPTVAFHPGRPLVVAPTAPAAPGVSQSTPGSDGTRLNPRYTFDTYVTGASNRFAHATAIAVAEAPARAYNPLFIYGGSGLGKTHLLHAIGHYARTLNPQVRVKYVNSEEFTADFIACLRDGNRDDGRLESFKRRYRDVDILLVDDIQFLEGKESTLEEFFHTFNALHSSGKQVVLTSDQPPKALGGLDERLRSRFEWGLLADVQPPDLETRIAILSRKARAEGLDLPLDVLEYIASRVTTNIRELEGALIRVTAFASLNKQPIDQTLAEMVLKDIISDPAGQEITTTLIMGQTADYFGITLDDLCGANRSRLIVNARHIAMYLCRELTDLSLPKIGREFGGRDHTTVMSADKKIRTLMAERRSTFTQVTELTSRIKQAASS